MKNIQDQFPNGGVSALALYDEDADEFKIATLKSGAPGVAEPAADVSVKNTVKVEVVNPPEPVKEVVVSNLKDIKFPEQKMPEPITFPESMAIRNWPEQKEIKFPDFPKSFEVSNLSELKLPAPQVTVPAPIVNVPAPVVNVPAPVVNIPAQKDFPTHMNTYQHVMKNGKWVPVEMAAPQEAAAPAEAPEVKFPTFMNTRDDLLAGILVAIRDKLDELIAISKAK